MEDNKDIPTITLSLGAKHAKFGLKGVRIRPNYEMNPFAFHFSDGVLVHNFYNKKWLIDGDKVLDAPSPETSYYIYAKCEKAGHYGTIVISTEKIKHDQEEKDYHFVVGVLHSCLDGERTFSLITERLPL